MDFRLILVIGIGLTFYLIPSIIASLSNHPRKLHIILVNIFGGLLFGLGWVVAFIWCFINTPKSATAEKHQTNA